MKTKSAAWSLADAGTNLSRVIDRALAEGPQVITREGEETVVVVSVEEWRRKSHRKGNLAEFFASSPLRGSELDLERVRDEPRDLPL
jgi:prevent-host-death family protein